jgi:hypothetical protein
MRRHVVLVARHRAAPLRPRLRGPGGRRTMSRMPVHHADAAVRVGIHTERSASCLP